jgi:hypothetical protein
MCYSKGNVLFNVKDASPGTVVRVPSGAYLFVLRFWLNSTKYAYFRESVLTH